MGKVKALRSPRPYSSSSRATSRSNGVVADRLPRARSRMAVTTPFSAVTTTEVCGRSTPKWVGANATSVPGELRVPLLEERGHAFAHVPGRGQQAEMVGLEVQSLVQRHLEAPVHGF